MPLQKHFRFLHPTGRKDRSTRRHKKCRKFLLQIHRRDRFPDPPEESSQIPTFNLSKEPSQESSQKPPQIPNV